jgi:phage/plasmid-like protein (TIGR03299 family)
MSDNLNIAKDGTAAFAAVGEKAWHLLGTYVKKPMNSEQAIKLGKLDYTVEKRKIRVVDGRIIPNWYANVRTDTNDVLGVVTGDYQIIQNSEAFSFFDSIVEKGEAIFQTVGALGLGEIIFITAKLPNDIEVNGDVIEDYLLLTTGHNGRRPIQIGFTPTRVVCQNTLTIALRNLKNNVTIHHTKNAKEQLEQAAKVMGMASVYTKEVNAIFNKMSKVKITDKKLNEYVMQAMKPYRETINKETLEVEYSTRHLNKINSVIDFIHEHPTQQTPATKGTWFGAYNGISGYFSYLKNYKTQDDKMRNLYFSYDGKTIENAFDLALTMMK